MTGHLTDRMQAIEAERKQHGVSQSELCRLADVHATTYTKILNGATQVPQRRTVARLRKAMDAFKQDAGRQS